MTPVVVTGAGLATAAGTGASATFHRWLEGTAPFVVPSDEWAEWPTALLGRAPIGDCGPLLPVPKLAKYAGRAVTLLVHAAHEALAEATPPGGPRLEPSRVGVYVASGQTGLEPATFFPALSAAWADAAPSGYAKLGARPARLIDPYFSLTTLANLGVMFLSLMANAEGPSTNMVHDATAGVSALRAALDDLEQGRVARAVVGAHDSWLVEQAALSLARRGWLLPRGHTDARPFDQDGAGMVAAEGAAVVVLERAGAGGDDANARAASSTAGTGAGADATSVQIVGAATATPTPADAHDEWSTQALGDACAAAGTAPGDVIVVQGTGLAAIDRSGVRAIAAACPGVAAVTSCAGVVGHVGAATAILQTALAAIMLRNRLIPPVAGQRHPFAGVPWAADMSGEVPFTAVTTLVRSLQGQVGAIRLRGVRSPAHDSW